MAHSPTLGFATSGQWCHPSMRAALTLIIDRLIVIKLVNN
jgi:hypothetical protein